MSISEHPLYSKIELQEGEKLVDFLGEYDEEVKDKGRTLDEELNLEFDPNLSRIQTRNIYSLVS